MTEGAASMEVGSAEPNQIRIVESRRLDPPSMRCDGVTHAKFQEALEKRVVTLAGGDIRDARPGHGENAQDEGCHPSHYRGKNFRNLPPRPRSQIFLLKHRTR